MKYSKNCPKCGIEMIYEGKSAQSHLTSSIKHNTNCRKCKTVSIETCKKISDAKKGKYVGENNPFYGKKHLKETKKKMSDIRKGKPTWASLHKEEISRKFSGENGPLFGRKLSKETKKKISDAKKGKPSPCGFKGHKRTDEWKKNHSKCQTDKYSDLNERKKTSILIKAAMHRPDVRKKHVDALNQSKWLKVKTDNGQLELLEKWNKLGFNFEPNYQIKTDLDLFYVDGYDPIYNVVIEYDSKYHNRLGQKEKDLIRQTKIIDILKPKKFWRYNSVNKQIKNVLEERTK